MNKSIKVLVISDYSTIHTSRPEAEIYIGLAKLGVDITIMTKYNSPYIERFKEAGIATINYHLQKKFSRKSVKFIRQTIIDGKYDILHLYTSNAIVNGIKAARNLPVKVVLYRGVPDNVFWYDPTSYLKYLNPRVDKIVCNAKAVEDFFHKQLFFNKDKTVTINKGHDVDWYSNTVPVNRKELGLSDNDFVVVFVGNNRPMKGVPYLLKAFNHLPADPPIHLLIAGNDMRNKINDEIVSSSPNRDKIHFIGYRDDILPIVAASDTLVLSSVKRESITRAVFEAMSLKIPAIITDISSNREFADNEKETVVVVPIKDEKAIADAKLDLYHNPERRKTIAKNGYNHIRTKLNNRQTVEKIKKLYEELVVE